MVESTTIKQQFTLDGTTRQFDFTFPTMPSYPEYIKAIALTGSTENELTYTTHYTVTVSSDGIGGTLWLVDAGAISKGTLTIYRETDNLQESDYDDYNQFPANTLERDIDRRTFVAQELAEKAGRTLMLPISATVGVNTTLPLPQSSKLIGWNSDADGLINYDEAQAVLPAINSGYAGYILKVNAEGTGYDLSNKLNGLSFYGQNLIVESADIIIQNNVGGGGAIICESVHTSLLKVGTHSVTGISTSGTLAGDSNSNLVTEKAVKTYVDAQASSAQFKVGYFTRDLSVAAGTQSVTGVGFQPKAVIFFASPNTDGLVSSAGVDDGSSHGSKYTKDNSGIKFNHNEGYSLYLRTGSGTYQVGYISSMDADGFTITWVKAGSPTGTYYIQYLAMG